jgi:3',5'-cyclic-AMP phosphodiesterase
MPEVGPKPSLTWVHFGDLHMTQGGEQNHRDFLALVDEVNIHLQGHVDFCLLPGDNADNGEIAQYLLIRSALSQLLVPVHIIPGDHDREPGNLTAFYSTLGVEHLPKALAQNGYRCLFLDMVSAGSGGPDFRLGVAQFQWLERELAEARAKKERCVLFMHAYPADSKMDGDRLLQLLKANRVVAVDMGHTHYNELTNDGQIIFATTRSTGQIEEGPVGFSVMNLEGDVVSWRFKPLDSSWPFVMITAPADEHLVTDSTKRDQVVTGPFTVHARAWSAAGITACRCRIGNGEWMPMEATAEPTRWMLDCTAPDDPFDLTVEAEDREGSFDVDSIQVATSVFSAPKRIANGSDADSVGAWPEKHILGTQLGPNRNGKHW